MAKMRHNKEDTKSRIRRDKSILSHFLKIKFFIKNLDLSTELTFTCQAIM